MTYNLLEEFRKKTSTSESLGFIPKTIDSVYVETAGYAGMDFIMIDMEHGPASIGTIQTHIRAVLRMFEADRKEFGEEVELLYDVHERIQPIDAINLCKSLEENNPLFIEDPLYPQNKDYFELLRQHTSVPISMGELFKNPHEWVGPISKRWFEFIRIHISQIGGITPPTKVAWLGEAFNVLTAWHGPGDYSPVGHACNAHISFATWNFGILEMTAGIMNE